MAVIEIKGWGQPLFAASGAPRSQVWHGFSSDGHALARPTGLCGETYEAVGPLRPLGRVPGEVCYYCRLVTDKKS
jgi:hypothetical protein